MSEGGSDRIRGAFATCCSARMCSPYSLTCLQYNFDSLVYVPGKEVSRRAVSRCRSGTPINKLFLCASARHRRLALQPEQSATLKSCTPDNMFMFCVGRLDPSPGGMLARQAQGVH